MARGRSTGGNAQKGRRNSHQLTAVAGIILAAGAAERMGQKKQLLPYKGIPLLQHAINVSVASKLDTVVLVTGASADEVEAALHLDRATSVRNPDYRRGNISSLECGAAQVPQAEAILLLMGDHPDVSGGVIDQMVSLWHSKRPWGAVTGYQDRVAHPFLLSKSALGEAAAIGGRKRLWKLLGEDKADRVVRLAIDALAPTDINTPEDYQRLLE